MLLLLTRVFFKQSKCFHVTFFRSARPGDSLLTAWPVWTFQTRMASEDPVTIKSPELCHESDNILPEREIKYDKKNFGTHK